MTLLTINRGENPFYVDDSTSVFFFEPKDSSPIDVKIDL